MEKEGEKNIPKAHGNCIIGPIGTRETPPKVRTLIFEFRVVFPDVVGDCTLACGMLNYCGRVYVRLPLLRWARTIRGGQQRKGRLLPTRAFRFEPNDDDRCDILYDRPRAGRTHAAKTYVRRS